MFKTGQRFICPLICSVLRRMNQRDTSFSPSSHQSSSLCAARNKAEPRGSRFDCCLSWLSLWAQTEGTRLEPARISSPRPLFLQRTLTPHLSTQVFCCPLYFHFFNCRFPRRRGHVLQLGILRRGTIIWLKTTQQTGTSMIVAEK